MAATFVLRLCAGAIICGILTELNREGPTGQAAKVLCGLFLLLTVLGPLGKLQIPDVGVFGEGWRREAAEAVAEGEQYALEMRQASIKKELQSYILDKAAEQGLELQATVTLSENGTPTGAALTGSPTAFQKQALEQILTETLGIPKEAVRWMEP